MRVCAGAGEGKGSMGIEQRCAGAGESEDVSGICRRLGAGTAEGLAGGRLRVFSGWAAHGLWMQKASGGSGEVSLRLGSTPRLGQRKAAAG